MAVPTNTLVSYSDTTIREDLIDVITNISPVDTWFLSNTGSGKATARYHEWPVDSLASPGANAVLEGDDATASAITPPTRTGNYTQILRKVFQISDSQEAFDKAGRGSDLSYQLEKHLTELATDIEYALIVNSTAVSGSASVARQMKGVLGWITTNVTTGTGTGSEPLTESMVNDNLQLIWSQGGKPSNVIVGAFQKRKFDSFTTNTRDIAASEKTLVAAVDVYKSSFGTLMVRLHHQMQTSAPDTVVIFGDMKLWRKAWARPVKPEKLARTGSSTKYMIEAELTLESRQEKGSGKITQLTTS